METTTRTASLTASQIRSMTSQTAGIIDRVSRSVCPEHPLQIDGGTECLERVALDLEVLQRQAAVAWNAVTRELERRKSA